MLNSIERQGSDYFFLWRCFWFVRFGKTACLSDTFKNHLFKLSFIYDRLLDPVASPNFWIRASEIFEVCLLLERLFGLFSRPVRAASFDPTTQLDITSDSGPSRRPGMAIASHRQNKKPPYVC